MRNAIVIYDLWPLIPLMIAGVACVAHHMWLKQ